MSTTALAEPRLFTREEYYALGEHGILKPNERTELINGQVIHMTPPGPWHGGSVNRSTHVFVRLFGDRAIVSIQNPIDLGELSQPEPDVAELRPRPDFYEQSHPAAADALFLIEISDSSYLYDKNVKMGLYAEAGVAEVWILHRKLREVTVHRKPELGEYTDINTYGPGSQISVPGLENVSVAVDELGI